MAVSHSPAGFAGTVDEIDEALRFAIGGGGRFRVASSSAWQLAVSGSTARTVTIAAGSAVACGVLDATSVLDTVVLAANTGGTNRFDAVVATFDWSAHTVTFGVITGGASAPAVNRTGSVDLAKINYIPGVRYDAVLGVVQVRPGVGILAPADLFDTRPWGDWSKLHVFSALYRDLMDVDPGAKIRETTGANTKLEYVRQIDGTWATEGDTGWADLTAINTAVYQQFGVGSRTRVKDGICYYQLAVQRKTGFIATPNEIVATMPAGRRPAGTFSTVGNANGVPHVGIDITSAGSVIVSPDASGSGGGLTFITASGSYPVD